MPLINSIMSFRYGPVKRRSKEIYRKLFPVQKSAHTLGKVKDICSIHLVPPEKLKNFFSYNIKRLQKIKGNDIGAYLEFGIFNGSSLSSMYLAAEELNVKMKFYGFDAFQGLPEGAEKEDDGVWKKGSYSCSYSKMKECLRKRKIDPDNITFVNGWYEDTLNGETKKRIGLNKIGIVFIDCDTYSSSKSVLDFIGPMLKEEAILCFDDWKLNDLDVKGMGEYKSFNEFLEQNTHLEAREIKSYNRKSRSFIIRPIKNRIK